MKTLGAVKVLLVTLALDDRVLEWAQFVHLNETLIPSTFQVPIAYLEPNLIRKSIWT